MPLHGNIIGNLGDDPVIRFTQAGKAVLNMRVGCTSRRLNQQTQQWEDQGDPLWLDVHVWGEEGERLAEVLKKGSKVTFSGIITRRVYQRKDGSTGESLEVDARNVGVITRTQQQGGQQPGYRPQPQQQAGQWGAPQGGSPSDPWRTSSTQQGGYGQQPTGGTFAADGEPPF